MNEIIKQLRQCPRTLLWTYIVVYYICGNVMNHFGKWSEIAQFRHDWQVFTVYVLYLVPISLTVRKSTKRQQYLVGLAALAPIELVGYRLGSSIAFDNNIIDQLFGVRNFTLAMSIFFGTYIPLGNWAVGKVHEIFFGKDLGVE